MIFFKGIEYYTMTALSGMPGSGMQSKSVLMSRSSIELKLTGQNQKIL